jgi:hypothetical protein
METTYNIRKPEKEINIRELFSEIQDWQDGDYIKPEGSRYGDKKALDEAAAFPATAKIFECCRPCGFTDYEAEAGDASDSNLQI